MFIRFGYNVEIDLQQPCVVQTVLDVHPSRSQDVVTITKTPFEMTGKVYVDVFGNTTRILSAPQGVVRLACDGVIRSDGQ